MDLDVDFLSKFIRYRYLVLFNYLREMSTWYTPLALLICKVIRDIFWIKVTDWCCFLFSHVQFWPAWLSNSTVSRCTSKRMGTLWGQAYRGCLLWFLFHFVFRASNQVLLLIFYCALLLFKLHIYDVLISFTLLLCFSCSFFLFLYGLVESQLRHGSFRKYISELFTKFNLFIFTDAVEKITHKFYTGVNCDLLRNLCTLWLLY